MLFQVYLAHLLVSHPMNVHISFECLYMVTRKFLLPLSKLSLLLLVADEGIYEWDGAFSAFGF